MKFRVFYLTAAILMCSCGNVSNQSDVLDDSAGDTSWEYPCGSGTEEDPARTCLGGEVAMRRCESECLEFCEDFYDYGTKYWILEKGLSCPSICDDLSVMMPAVYRFEWDSVDECTYFLNSFSARSVESLSVVPAHKEDDGTYTRQCVYDSSRKADSLLMSFALVGNGIIGSHGATHDNDSAIRPGDVIKTADADRVVLTQDPEFFGPYSISEEQFDVNVNCLDPYPVAYQTVAPASGSSGIACSREQSIDGAPAKITYANNLSDGTLRLDPDQSGISVAIMIDQSGSMKGYVEGTSYAEISVDSRVSIANFATRATDYQAFRTVAVQALMRQLNSGDRAGIFQFGEAVSDVEAKILCDGTYATEALARSACFGKNRSILNSNLMTSLQSEAEGRTPLWQSVKDVYKFMKETESTRARHIFIITDGPDTCARNSVDFLDAIRWRRTADGPWLVEDQSDSCSDVAWEDFRDYIWDDVMNADGTPKGYDEVPVHISFVQMQSRGYPNVDPFQQEASCLTGGHYVFINATDLPGSSEIIQDGNHPLQEALTAAANRFRYSMSGIWQAAKKVNDLSDGSLTAGSVIALDGEIGVVSSDTSLFSDSMRATMTMKVTSDVDTRGTFMVPSAGQDLDCQWMPLSWADKDDDKVNECRVSYLSEDTDVCTVSDANWGTVCATGLCCYGKCIDPAPDCQVMDDLCNYDNVEDGTTCTGGTCDGGICVAAGA